MKILKKIALAVVMLIVFLALVGFFLPRTFHIERSVSIRGKAADVYPYLSDLKTWESWTAWNKTRYADMQQEMHEPSAGPGASYSWTGKKSGDGTIKLVKADPNTGVTYDLDFMHGQALSKGEIRTEQSGDNVKVTWTNEGDLGANPMCHYFGLLMDGWMGPDFEKGLANLKAKVESAPPAEPKK